MNSLELFSGEGTFSKVAKSIGFLPYSIDINPRHNPTICVDLLDFEYSSIPSQFDLIWASPDCRYFSREANPKHWKKTLLKYRQYLYTPQTPQAFKALTLVDKTIEIINHYHPKGWFLENPIGRIHHTIALKSIGHYRYCVNYKDWGFNYSKETYIFTNILLPLPTKKVIRPGLGLNSVNNRIKRSSVPIKLIEFLLSHI